MYDYERFARTLASIDIPRSKFPYRVPVKTTFNHGQIIPIAYEEVLPGDTWQLEDFSCVLRLSSPLKTPIMDDITASIFIFFVPFRILWSHFKQFMFENTESSWIPQTEYTLPMITAPTGGWNPGSLADYFNVRPNINVKINQMKFRAYCEVYNEWFRDQNLIDPVFYDKGDSDLTGTNGTDYVNDVIRGSVVMNISRHRDYFASCLPGPQKGPEVLLPLGTITADEIPVIFGDKALGDNYPINPDITGTEAYAFGTQNSSFANVGNLGSYDASVNFNGKSANLIASGVSTVKASATINELRTAFQLQKFYERLALGGSRYTEVIRSFFNVQSSDARLQRPEFLAGDRFSININQVTDNASDLAKVGAYSMTYYDGIQFEKSFEEHGLLLGLIATQHSHSYQQGMDRFDFKEDFTNFFFPVFNNLGEQPVFNREIYATGTDADNEVFGYQENYPEYRTGRSRVTGQFRSGVTGSLDTWHLSDYYESQPILSKEWIEETPNILDRVLQVAHTESNQYLLDCCFNFKVSRAMSEYGVPGLIDHH